MKKLAFALMAAAVLTAAACGGEYIIEEKLASTPVVITKVTNTGSKTIEYYHDWTHEVSCWYMTGGTGVSLFCLPDAQVKGLSR